MRETRGTLYRHNVRDLLQIARPPAEQIMLQECARDEAGLDVSQRWREGVGELQGTERDGDVTRVDNDLT